MFVCVAEGGGPGERDVSPPSESSIPSRRVGTPRRAPGRPGGAWKLTCSLRGVARRSKSVGSGRAENRWLGRGAPRARVRGSPHELGDHRGEVGRNLTRGSHRSAASPSQYEVVGRHLIKLGLGVAARERWHGRGRLSTADLAVLCGMEVEVWHFHSKTRALRRKSESHPIQCSPKKALCLSPCPSPLLQMGKLRLREVMHP